MFRLWLAMTYLPAYDGSDVVKTCFVKTCFVPGVFPLGLFPGTCLNTLSEGGTEGKARFVKLILGPAGFLYWKELLAFLPSDVIAVRICLLCWSQ